MAATEKLNLRMNKFHFFYLILYSNKRILSFYLLLTFFITNQLKAQSKVELNQSAFKQPVIIHKGTKRMNLNHYDEFSVIYTKTSKGQDSLNIQIFTSEMRYKKDTLIIKPTDLNMYRFMDTINAYSETKDFAPTTTITIKIPTKEIESIKSKKQPLSKITGGIASVSYVSLLCSPFIAMSQNSSVSNFGIGLFLVSAPVLAISWSINGIYAKKRFYFDPERTHKKIWKFE